LRAGEVTKGSQGREVFKKFPSKAKFHEVGTCTLKFCLSREYRVYIPSKDSHAAYPPIGFVAISPKHLKSGFRFPVAPYILNLLNEVKLTPFQLTPNLYVQLTSLAILFPRNQLFPLSSKLINFFFPLRVLMTPVLLGNSSFSIQSHPSPR